MQDNWSDGIRYDKMAVEWTKCHQDIFIYETKNSSLNWKLRLNDFPEEPLFTLFVGTEEILNFNDWPNAWIKPND